VLNIGDTAVPGAVARVAELRASGKRLVMLTNSASQSRADALAKYRRLGFDFGADEIVASRDLAAEALRRTPRRRWAVASGPDPDFSDLGEVEVADLLADTGLLARAEGFVLASSSGWSAAHQEHLEAALRAQPRPVLIANPDLVAPREDGLSLEPGEYAHRLWDATGVVPAFYGKPYPNAFAAAHERLGRDIPPARIAMVGDTLHTDILGGRAAGFATVLVTDHGLFAGRDVAAYVQRSGIVPDVVVPTT
jgi:HAD superfamily hydrolase (TIGR01450 family)